MIPLKDDDEAIIKVEAARVGVTPTQWLANAVKKHIRDERAGRVEWTCAWLDDLDRRIFEANEDLINGGQMRSAEILDESDIRKLQLALGRLRGCLGEAKRKAKC